MRLRIDGVDIECTSDEAAKLLTKLRKGIPYEGQPGWKVIVPPDSTTSYQISVGRTYSAGTSGDSVHNYEVWHWA